MDLHVDIIPGKEVAQFIRDLDTFGYFHQHTLFDGVLMSGLFIVNEHETSMSFAKKNDHGSKFSFETFDLGISADADFQTKTFFGLSPDRIFNGFNDGEIDRIAIKLSP
jgi:hypothetical protein